MNIINIWIVCDVEFLEWNSGINKKIFIEKKKYKFNPYINIEWIEKVEINIKLNKNFKSNWIIKNNFGNDLYCIDKIYKGDLIIKINKKFNENYKIINDVHLLTNISISLIQALCGFEISFEYIDKKKIWIRNTNKIINNNKMYKIKNMGLNINNKLGNLYIKFDVIFPEYIKQDIKNKISNFFLYDNENFKNDSFLILTWENDSLNETNSNEELFIS